MSPLQKNTIQHFTHPQHSLTTYDSNTKYLCDGCKIPGIGKRYHCHGCDFDLHEYCGECPMNLSSFMHPHHSLNLVVRKSQANRQNERTCNVCCDIVEGLFYRCNLCDFVVHPLCTQLPETLRHVLHQVHPLKLLDSSQSGICAVCRGACNASSWRYRCVPCGFDIHLECLLVQCEKKSTHRGISYVPPYAFHQPQNFDGYAHGTPYWNNSYPNPYAHGNPYWNNSYPNPYAHGNPYWNNSYPNPFYPGPSNMNHHYMPHPHPQSHAAQAHAQAHHGGGGGGWIGRVMFNLVTTLGVGEISDMIFGMDVSSFF